MFLVSNPIINYTAYETMKKYLMVRNKKSVGSAAIFVIGCIAKIIATYATYPVLTIRVQLQHDSNNKTFSSLLIGLFKSPSLAKI